MEAERLQSNQRLVNWLISMGLDMGGIDPAQARRIVRNIRRDSLEAEAYYTRLLTAGAGRLCAPRRQLGAGKGRRPSNHAGRILGAFGAWQDDRRRRAQ